MTRTKRILALFLAVVLCFSALPFSVSADEITGSVVATFTTDSAGHATLSTPLEDGTYSVKEASPPPKGYKLDTKVYTFTIDGGDTSLTVEDEPGTLTLKLKKKDSQTGSTPQGNASLAGTVYQVSYQKGGQTVTEELTSDAQGNLGTLEGIPFGTVTIKELSAPEGYRLDTEVHTYTVDGSQLVGDIYTLEVDDLAEEVQRGGLTIQKQDSETGTTPQGDASLEGISFEIVNQSQNPVVVNGNTAKPGEVVMTITTDASGVATTDENALPYQDIIHLSRPVSHHPKMSVENRAKLFMPFSALRGFDIEILTQEQDRLLVPQVRLSNDQREIIWRIFNELQKGDWVTVTYFQPVKCNRQQEERVDGKGKK